MREDSNEIIDAVREAVAIPAIVEGKRDRIALEKLGFYSIIELDRPLFEVVERFEHGSTVQILTDFDKEGKELYGKLFRDLTRRGVKVDNTLRHVLLRTDLSHVEGLHTYLSNIL